MVKKLLTFVVLISIQSIAQTFTSGMIEYGNGSSNIFSTTSIGPDGKFYCFFNDGNYTHSSNNVNPVYRLVRWESSSSSWASVANLDASVIPGVIISSTYTMFNDGMAMEVDASGGYHILMNLYTANGTEIKYAYSSNGTAWTYTSIDNSNNQTNYSYTNLQMKLDSSNRPHIYYLIRNIGTAGISSRVYTIIHKYFNGSSWVSETAYTQTGGNGTSANELGMMSASLDSNNKSHIGFVAETNNSGTDGSLLYANNISGSWSAPVFIATGATLNPAADRVYILSDTNNKQHIVYRDNSTSLKVKYATNKSGTWSTSQINNNLTSGIMSSTDGYYSFTRNNYNDLLLVYNASTSTTNTGQVNYACLFNGGSNWQIGNIFTGNSRTGQYISARYTNANSLMVTFDHFTGTGTPSYTPTNNPRQLQYATSIVSNLSAVETQKSEIKVYPNPAKSFVNLDVSQLTNVSLQVLDMSGKILMNNLPKSNAKVDVSALSPGTYIIKVNSDQGTKTTKIVKQ